MVAGPVYVLAAINGRTFGLEVGAQAIGQQDVVDADRVSPEAKAAALLQRQAAERVMQPGGRAHGLERPECRSSLKSPNTASGSPGVFCSSSSTTAATPSA